jgi:F0F1-type ATP synthase delta subunit
MEYGRSFMSKSDELQEKIEEMQEQLARLKRVQQGHLEGTRSLEDITTEEKVEAFDSLYHQVRENLVYLMKNGRERKDHIHYVWESVIRRTLGGGAFDIMNEVLR